MNLEDAEIGAHEAAHPLPPIDVGGLGAPGAAAAILGLPVYALTRRPRRGPAPAPAPRETP